MRILIVGGVAGGASAAARARRLSENAKIIIFERGEHVSFANCGLPYHIGGVIPDRQKLLIQTPEALRKRFCIDVRVRTEVQKIDRIQKMLTVQDLVTGKEYQEAYDYLVLSPGAAPIKPPIPGLDLPEVFTLRNIADMDRIKNCVDSHLKKRAIIVGGGYIGLEMAEALRTRGLGVTIIELSSQVMGPVDPEMAYYLHEELRKNGAEIKFGVSVKGFYKQGDEILAELSNGQKIPGELVVLAIGVKPEVKLAQEAGLEIGERGGIVTNEEMKTSDPYIFAVGDALEVDDLVTSTKALIPLAGPANRQGRIAADNIFGRHSIYKKTQGTAICKVFDLTIAMTGASEKILQRLKKPFEKVYIHSPNHAGYYPNAKQISMKLLFCPNSGKILGAQAVGMDGVDKRMDVLSVALRAGMTVFDLENLELCYAPSYGSAKDTVNFLGFVASNLMRGDVGICHTADVVHLKEDQVVLDVRSPQEAQAGMIPSAINIPIDCLRDKISTLSKDKEYLVYCQVGLRGYLASRVLTQNGFKCKNLSGGYQTYKASLGNSR
ncbi:MAG: FAD-dependent oxidoreductase [Candidatus Omnitrophica bacterium]|nr:FAD-dependent oxidoreductase [Candidatus Omnitrophota bacterium]